MNKLFTILVVVFAIVAVVMITSATSSSSTKIITVADLSKLGAHGTAKRIQLGARVSASQPIDYQVEPKISLTFFAEDPGVVGGAVIPVEYDGLKPDMFTAGRDVIVSGDLIDGRFIASTLLTQCPSKYEPPKPAER